MKKKPTLVWLIPLVLLLLLIPFIVPSAVTGAGAEDVMPPYAPVELSNPNPEPLAMPDPTKASAEHYQANPDCFIYDESTGLPCGYQDDTIYIKIESGTVRGNTVYFTWVQIADATQMRTFARRSDAYPDRMAKALDSLLAFNADWFSDRGGGVIYRNSVLMRPEKDAPRHDVLLIDDQGDFHILRRPTLDDFAPYAGHILHSFLFGPGLVIDGELMTKDMDTFFQNHYGTGNGMGLTNRTQRQIFCQMDKLSYLIITTEGPQETKDGGFTAAEAAELAYTMGAKNAYNLDGGNSACVVMRDPRANRYVKLNRYKKTARSIPDLIYFVTAVPDTWAAAADTQPADPE